jgi:hypothetical protein
MNDSEISCWPWMLHDIGGAPLAAPGNNPAQAKITAPGNARASRVLDHSRAPQATPLIGSPKLFINLGAKARKEALERERPRIVNNFAPSASAGYELAPHPQQRIVGEFRAG